MGLMQKLVEIYDVLINSNDDKIPISTSHSEQNAHIEILLDRDGNLMSVSIVQKDDASTLIPVTINSASRTSGIEAHPLFDKLQYLSKDLVNHIDRDGMKQKKIDDLMDSNEKYLKQLDEWISFLKQKREKKSHYSPEEALKRLIPVSNYLRNNNIIEDLAQQGIIALDENRIIDNNLKDKNELLKLITSQESAFIRFRVHTGLSDDKINHNRDLQESFIDYFEEKINDSDICMITGKFQKVTDKHPKRIRHAGDGSKLISANDSINFTYRGRFTESEEALSVGYEASEKTHNALKWLIQNQGIREGETIFLSFGTHNEDIPNPFASLIFEEDEEDEHEDITDKIFADKLNRAIKGYHQKLNPDSSVIAMILDSATPGRLSIVFYRELLGSEFLKNIQQWNEKTSWELLLWDRENKKSYFLNTIPTPIDIAKACYGKMISDKLLKATLERLYKCIIDGDYIPRDLLEQVKHRVSNPEGMENFEWERALRIACAMFRNYYEIKEKEVNVLELDKNINDRSYLYGRLLAVADWIEQGVLNLENQKRATNALRYMNAFSNNPFKTWGIIKNAILPYQIRQNDYRDYYDRIMEEIMSKFTIEEFENNRPLNGKYILGYYHQRESLRNKKERIEDKKEKTENIAEDKTK